MKCRLIIASLILMSGAVFAEASFDQVERLIENKNYTVAELALEEIIKNHPRSAKAYYAMAQAQAGKGNLGKAQYALDKAQALDPTLSFASSSNVDQLRQAITPQTQKIEYVSESHFWRNVFIFLIVALSVYALLRYRQLKKDDGDFASGGVTPTPTPPQDSPSDRAYMRDHNLLDESLSRPSDFVKPRQSTNRSKRVSEPVQVHTYQPQPTVVNNHYGSNNNDLLTGVLLGDMINHHNTTAIIERETILDSSRDTIREDSWGDDRTLESIRESTKKDRSWDSDSSSSRSSSWDSDSSSSRSSSWDSDSSSSRSSSWDSDSSSSSSSWDSSSDSSSSSSDSSW